MSKKPLAVLISDVHYSMNTLEVADIATRMAIKHANELGVRLIVCGDLHDTKANLRAECVNAMLATFRLCLYNPIILVGNHCKVNAKSQEHSLNFLSSTATIVDRPVESLSNKMLFLPYYDSKEDLLKILDANRTKFAIVFMHQGVTTAKSGEYIQDKSAITTADLAGFRVISGHYHTRQTIDLIAGQFDYVGNPYTLNFAEASDPGKGYQILYSDYSLEFVPTNLRKHVVTTINGETEYNSHNQSYREEDILWIKITGASDWLAHLDKKKIAKHLKIKQSFKLDLMSDIVEINLIAQKTISQEVILDDIISSLSNTDVERKGRLKTLWKELLETN